MPQVEVSIIERTIVSSIAVCCTPMAMQQLFDKVNAAGAQRLQKDNTHDHPRCTSWYYRVDYNTVLKGHHFKYIGSFKSSDGDCFKDVNVRIVKTERGIYEIITPWKDRSIPVAPGIRLVNTLVVVWTVLYYGAEARTTLTIRDERKIPSLQMWFSVESAGWINS